jgi:hypothetical protein
MTVKLIDESGIHLQDMNINDNAPMVEDYIKLHSGVLTVVIDRSWQPLGAEATKGYISHELIICVKKVS